MTNFEKALEEESDKYENTLDVIGWAPDVVYGAKNGFELGATWSRQYTVAEVCKMLRDNYINGGKGMADFIEQHFKESGAV